MEKINDIKTPEDILEFMKRNIKYGYIDLNGEKHINTLKGFRTQYRTLTVEDTIKNGIGTCIEQVNLMHYLLDNINIPNKMFCTRIVEKGEMDPDAEEHMHCFLLYYIGDKVFQIEHPNPEKVGIYEYTNEEDAIKKINDYYIEMSGGILRPVTEFEKVPPNLSFKEFNDYINNLDIEKRSHK
jgi:hypothetical protein